MLIGYFRNKKGNPVGVMVSQKINGTIVYGTSTCHAKDKFDKKTGTMMAMHRLIDNTAKTPADPIALGSRRKQFERFIIRSKNYFFNARHLG